MVLARVEWRGVITDADTVRCWQEAANRTGDIYLDPFKGSYLPADSNSAGTHVGAGVGDFICTPLTGPIIEKALRSVGCAAWYRPANTTWRDHVHAGRIDCPELSADMRTQCNDYLAGYNGLPVGGRIRKDTGDRSFLNVRWLTLEKELDMPLTDTEINRIAAAVANWPVVHPADQTKTLPWKTSAWSANTYAWMGYKNTVEILKQMGADVDDVDEAAIAAALAPALIDKLVPALSTAVSAELNKLPVNEPVSAETVESALRKVLGSLDSVV